MRREDGSWLMDGGLDLDTVLRTLDDDSLLTHEDRQHYHTLGGLVMLGLGVCREPMTYSNAAAIALKWSTWMAIGWIVFW